MTANILDFFKKAGSVLYDDPTVQAYCGALQEAYHNSQTGLYKENEKCLIYDFDAIADRILANDRTLLPDLICYYKCEDNASNTKVVDIVNAHNGVASANTKTFSTSSGAVGRGFDFDAANNDYVTIPITLPDGAVIDIDEAWTIKFICNFDTLSNGMLLSTSTALDITGLSLYPYAPGQFLELYAYDGASNRWKISSAASSISTSGDYEVAITNDGSGVIAGMNLYINSVAATSKSSLGTVSSISNSDITVGHSLYGGTQYHDGLIDEIGIWKAELSAAQISNLYNSGSFSTYVYSVLLDYLAWQFRVYLWDKSQDPTTKLNLLKQSLKFRGKIGTPWAVKQAIELVASPDNSDFTSFPIVITEGTGGAFYNGAYDFDGTINFDSNYSPFKFDVSIPQITTPTTTDQALFLKAIDSYKNARSWLNAVTYPGLHFGGNIELNDSILAYYKLDDNAADTVVVDSTGGYNGVAYANTSVLHNTSGKIGSCFDFSPSSVANFQASLESTPGSIFDIDKGYCTSFWIYRGAGTSNISVMGNVNSSTVGTYLIYQGSITSITFIMRDLGTGMYWYARGVIPVGFSHVFAGHIGDSLYSGMRLYINNSLIANSAPSGPTGSVAVSDPWRVGDTPVLSGYNDRIDEVGIWNKAPTASMASALYNSGAGLTY
jgi:hypothetical protein